MLPTGWICLDGTVIVDDARTLTYLRRGLGGAKWNVALRAVQAAEGGYSDTYVDAYNGDPFDPYNLACYCALVSEGPYVSPADDPAPWYVAARPESAEFLGFILTDFDVRPVASRYVTLRPGGGALIGPGTPKGRTVGVEVVAVATSPAGMAWGQRWLADALGAAGCTGEPGELEYLPACPSDPSDTTVFRRLRGVALIDGPTFVPIGETPGCEAETGRFQMAAESPYLHSPVVSAGLDPSLVPGASVSALISAPEWSGVVAPVIRVDAASAGVAGPITVTVTPVAAGQSCPEPGSANPCSQVTITALPASGVIIFDHPIRKARYADPTLKVERSAYGLLEWDGPFAWVDVPPCSNVCVTVTNGGSTIVGVTIDAETLEP